ncbi:Solute carrier family 22 member 15 [Hondaea fermentalgiana]|uniref:Solute carrier family 22 member 15 n=1 Tax=Hondaea fermentalgiana TaxID=2315210 RepID=A0A2R5G5V5_9STRA|nr:Solute carrier family 22 member 15 [Hondaea fermentalgiana]|eukprot:GBG26427.1 Solute carrier family 22 member 15 [Hondaea fermentalgiana]
MSENASLWRKGIAADTSPPPLASERIDEENQLLRDAQREQQTIEFANKLRLARHLTMASAIYLLVSSWLTVSALLHKLSLALALLAGLVLIMPLGLSVKAWCVHTGRDTATAPELQPILQRQQDRQDTAHQTTVSTGAAAAWAEEILEREVGVGKMQWAMLAVCGGTQFSDALELILLPLLASALTEEPESSPMRLRTAQDGWLLSFCVFAGMLVGAPAWGWVADKFGRRVGTFGTAALVGVAGFGSSLASSLAELFTARFFVGCGLGGASCALAWFSESLPPRKREPWLVGFFLFFSVGSVACAGLAWATLGGTGDWRLFLRLASMPSLVVAGLSLALPESAVFVATRGDRVQASEILQGMGQVNGRQIGLEADATRVETTSFITREIDCDARRDDAKDKSTKPILALCGLFAVMAIVYYALVELSVMYLWPEDGDGLSDSTFLQILIVNAAELPGLFGALHIVKRRGSRISVALMFAICGGFCLAMATIAFVFPAPGKFLETLLLFGARASALGFNQSLWIYSSTYFTAQHRALGVGAVTAFARIGGLISPIVGQLLFDRSPGTALISCAALCAAAALASLGVLPDVSQRQDWETS